MKEEKSNSNNTNKHQNKKEKYGNSKSRQSLIPKDSSKRSDKSQLTSKSIPRLRSIKTLNDSADLNLKTTETPIDIYKNLDQQSPQNNLNAIWQNKTDNILIPPKEPGIRNTVLLNPDLVEDLNESEKKLLIDYKKQLMDEFNKELKHQIQQMKDQLEKEQNVRVQRLKETYLSELKLLKDQDQAHINQLKKQEKLIQKLFRISYKQEFQLSTEDFRLYLELDREPQLNMLDIGKIRQEQEERQQQNQKIEIEASEYINMKEKLKEMELQNSMLLTQARVLKNQTLKEIGTADQIHKQMAQRKIMKSKKNSLVTQTSGLVDFSEQFIEGVNQRVIDEKTEKILNAKKQEILKTRRQTYEESILIKQLNMSHSAYQNDNKLVVDMIQLGIPPRPETELIEEMALSKQAQIDGQYIDKLEKLREDIQREREEMKLKLEEKEEEIRQLNDRLEKMRSELRKAIFVLRNKVFMHQNQILKFLQADNADIKAILEETASYQQLEPSGSTPQLHQTQTPFSDDDLVHQARQPTPPVQLDHHLDQQLFEQIQELQQPKKSRQILSMSKLTLSFSDLKNFKNQSFSYRKKPQLENNSADEGPMTPPQVKDILSQTSGLDDILLQKYLQKRYKHPFMLKYLIHDEMKRRRLLEDLQKDKSISYSDIEEVLKVLRLSKSPNSNKDLKSQFEDELQREQKLRRKEKLIQEFNLFKISNIANRIRERNMVKFGIEGGSSRGLLNLLSIPNRSSTPIPVIKKKKKQKPTSIITGNPNLEKEIVPNTTSITGRGYDLESDNIVIKKRHVKEQITNAQIISLALAMKKKKLKEVMMMQQSSNNNNKTTSNFQM